MPALIFPVSFLVFLLGFLDRFGIRLLQMEGANPEFISTIGNINWYCGYLVTVLFGGVYLLWREFFYKRWQKLLLTSYVFMGFAALITQGSSSGILTMAVIFFLLFCLSVTKQDAMFAFCKIMVLFSAACVFTYTIRFLFPEAINYREPLTDFLTNTLFPVFLLLFSCAAAMLVKAWSRKRNYPNQMQHVVPFLLFLGIALFGTYIIMGIMNTVKPGSIGIFSQYSMFRFTPEWGSKRGATWLAGLRIWNEQGVWKKLVGIGPDCMGIYGVQAAGNEIQAFLNSQFGGLRLTNAHNELITVLVNCGVLGLAGFLGMVCSFISMAWRRKDSPHKTDIAIMACAFGVLAYLVHNMVSFEQIMNCSMMYLLLGVGGALDRKKNN